MSEQEAPDHFYSHQYNHNYTSNYDWNQDDNTHDTGPYSYYNYAPGPPGPGSNDMNVYDWMSLITSVPCLMLVCGFGTVTNIINLVVFHRQGILSDSSTVSLACLALSDLCLCALSFISSLIYLPKQLAILGGSWEDSYSYDGIALMVTLPVPIFIKGTCWTTVFIALERMVSVTFPFHVKLIFTTGRSCGVIGAIFVISVIIDIPTYLPIPMFPETEGEKLMEDLSIISSYMNDFVLRLSSIVIVFILNIIIAVKVVGAKRFRNKSKMASTETNHRVTNSAAKNLSIEPAEKISTEKKKKEEKAIDKEMKLVVMVTVLCVMFFVCYSITGLLRLVMRLSIADILPPISIAQLMAVEYSGKLLEGLNSSCNILIYYTMSTRYKTELRQLCKCLKD